MRTIKEDAVFFKQLMDMLETQLSVNEEIVLHDLTNDYDHTIVDIRHGHVTNRKVGDCGSNLGLEVLRGTVENGDRYNYVTHTRDGKILRSSTMFIHDEDHRVIGSICINRDITETIKLEAMLREANRYVLPQRETASPIADERQAHEHETKEVFFNNINELLEHMLETAMENVGKPADKMTREDRLQFLKYLDDKGMFVISKSGDRVCEFLGISKFTLYNYLDAIRKGGEASETAEN
ncbi:MAG: helix-turn-helix transcriptional regulator [Candidatus Limiplasma sp.]|nr:helix-turn-helix transcriptional regulator [Clostridiales bacterium]MDY3816692.1 helix-turn-helix transcriptional regulator [Candidatus Limiplasma sp.]